MRIGVDAHLLPQGETYRSAGVATYVRQLVDRLPRVAPQHRYVFFAPPGSSGAGIVPARLPTQRPMARILWEQAVAPLTVKGRRLQVLHGAVNVGPLVSTVPLVLTIHDLAHLEFPDAFLPTKRAYLRLMIAASARRAARVICPSEATRSDVIDALGIDPDSIVVIPEGVDDRFTVRTDLASPLPFPYILYVGTIEPRKNLPVLLRAFALLREHGCSYRLALVGPPGWLYEDVHRLITHLSLGDSVVMPGFVADLLPWYNCAGLFVYPSLYEGFGLPPLEAMACGTPVVMSSAGALREVAGDAALVVAPSDHGALSRAMLRVLEDPGLAGELREAGRRHSARFSWDETIRRTVLVYEDAVRV